MCLYRDQNLISAFLITDDRDKETEKQSKIRDRATNLLVLRDPSTLSGVISARG